jgi:hypothetical protein
MTVEIRGKWQVARARFLTMCLILLMFGGATSLRAQTGTATLSGTIMDPAGRVVPGVDVRATKVDTGVATNTKTNGDGIYVFPALQPGRYRVIVAKQGFKQIALTDITLSTQDSVSRNFNLEVGAVSETVTVNANNEHMETDNPAVGLLVDRTFVENMPLNGRSFQDLIALAPGVVSSTTSNVGSFSVNGQRDDANYFTVDGVSGNTSTYNNSSQIGPALAGVLPSQTALGTTQSLASVDALEEFRIETSGYSAQYGRQPGGQVAITTRSGANDFHGSVFDYFRNEALDANGWFFNHYGIPRQAERQNDFGGTIGGRVVVPKVYDGKDRTFFFFSYEGLRLKLPAFLQDYYPLVSYRNSSSPAVQPYLNAYPIPNGPATGDGVTGLFTGGYSNPSSIDSISLRIDHSFGSHVNVFGRYADTPSSMTARVGSTLSSLAFNSHLITVGATAVITNDLSNELRFNFTTTNTIEGFTLDSFGGAIPFPKSLILPTAYASGPYNLGTVEPSFTSASVYCCDPLEYGSTVQKQRQYNLIDSFNWKHGVHSFVFGGDYRKLLPYLNEGKYQTQFVLASDAAYQQGFADLALIESEQPAYPVIHNLSLFGQDSWKVTRRLTLDLGLRWELNPSPGSTNGILPLVIDGLNDFATMRFAPKGTALYRTTYRDFAPRIGFAYEAISSTGHPTVVRGAFGIFYDTGQGQAGSGFYGYPFQNFAFINDLPLPAEVSSIAPLPVPAPLTPPYRLLSVVNPQLKLPYTEQWNLSVDEGLTSRNTLTVSYAGNQGHRLLNSQEFNASTVNPDFTYLIVTNNVSASNYNALQIQDHGYVTQGMQIIGSYTWAHAIDNVSTDNVYASQGGLLRGNSDNDFVHVFNAAVNYKIPGVASNRVVQALANGWSVDVRSYVQSGAPIDVISGNYLDPGTGQLLPIRANTVPGQPFYLRNQPGAPGGWQLNPAAFTPVPLNSDGIPVSAGTLGRNQLHAPNVWGFNTAFQRNFHIVDQLGLVFRVEAFNLLNHANFGLVQNNLLASNFGQVQGNGTFGAKNSLYATGGPRSLQIVLKLVF